MKRVCFQVSTLHTDMVKWMVHMLLHLAQTTTALSPEAKHSLDLDMMSPENLELEAESLFTQVTRFTLQTQRYSCYPTGKRSPVVFSRCYTRI